jgi:Asp-tRNA(Asn)/Glu-tRNA(Gln) amidotransferase A subunit family amidase
VVFIALMLAPGVLARYALWAKEERNAQLRKVMQAERTTGKVSGTKLWAVLRRYDLVVLPATLAFVFFLWGEIGAVSALDHRHATAAEHTGVTWSLIGLPVLTVLSVIGALAFDRKAILGSDED